MKAERDILAEADNEWVVKLYYSFQVGFMEKNKFEMTRLTFHNFNMKLYSALDLFFIKQNFDLSLSTSNLIFVPLSIVSTSESKLNFQDRDNLYFVMDYIPGGDLMSLLIKFGIFQEELAQ